MEQRYRRHYQGAKKALWIHQYLEHKRADGKPQPTTCLFQDNAASKILAEKGRASSARTRHINIRYFFIKDRIDSGELAVEYLPTGDMVGDFLSKPVQGELFRRFRAELMGHNAMHNWK